MKYRPVIILAAAAIAVWLLLRDTFDQSGGNLFVPADTSFVPVHVGTYRPPSTPFESAKKPPVQPPRGMREQDVQREHVIIKKIAVDSGRFIMDTTRIVEGRDGAFFVQRQPGAETSVYSYNFLPPLISFGTWYAVGFTIGRAEGVVECSPALSVSFVDFAGRVQLPLSIDLAGVGAGVDVKVVNNMHGGVICFLGYNGRSGMRLSFRYII